MKYEEIYMKIKMKEEGIEVDERLNKVKLQNLKRYKGKNFKI